VIHSSQLIVAFVTTGGLSRWICYYRWAYVICYCRWAYVTAGGYITTGGYVNSGEYDTAGGYATTVDTLLQADMLLQVGICYYRWIEQVNGQMTGMRHLHARLANSCVYNSTDC